MQAGSYGDKRIVHAVDEYIGRFVFQKRILVAQELFVIAANDAMVLRKLAAKQIDRGTLGRLGALRSRSSGENATAGRIPCKSCAARRFPLSVYDLDAGSITVATLKSRESDTNRASRRANGAPHIMRSRPRSERNDPWAHKS